MRHFSILITAAVLAFSATGAINAEDKPAQPGAATAAAAVESATATGTVTATDDKRHSFTFKEDGSDDALEYRAYYRSPEVKAILEQIKNLKVGDRITVTYTENEGRRAMKIVTAPAK